MITLHRLGQADEPFQLNPDMIVTVESTPDTVISLATGAKVVVAETPQEVAAAVSAYRAMVMSEALRRRRPERPSTPGQRDSGRLSAVEDHPRSATHRDVSQSRMTPAPRGWNGFLGRLLHEFAQH